MSSSRNNLEKVDDTLETRETAKQVAQNLLPDKSRNQYKQCNDQFVQWQKQKKTTSMSEDTLLVC